LRARDRRRRIPPSAPGRRKQPLTPSPARPQRLANIVVLLVGLTLAGYAVYMIVVAKGVNALSGSVLALGAIDAGLALALVTCGASSVFLLRLYAFVIGLLELGQIAVAALFLVPSTQASVINAIGPPADLRKSLEANLPVAGYVLLAVVGFQGLTLALVLAQSCSLDGGFDERAYEREALSAGGRYASLVADDEAGATTAAAARYKAKASKYYDKYNISSK